MTAKPDSPSDRATARALWYSTESGATRAEPNTLIAGPADRAEITQARADELLGFFEADAQRCAAELGWAYRVGMRDGESFALTEDYSLQRVTVTVENDVVTAIIVG